MGDEVGVVHVPHGTMQHTDGEVQREATVGEQLQLSGLQDALLGAPHLEGGGRREGGGGGIEG